MTNAVRFSSDNRRSTSRVAAKNNGRYQAYQRRSSDVAHSRLRCTFYDVSVVFADCRGWRGDKSVGNRTGVGGDVAMGVSSLLQPAATCPLALRPRLMRPLAARTRHVRTFWTHYHCFTAASRIRKRKRWRAASASRRISRRTASRSSPATVVGLWHGVALGENSARASVGMLAAGMDGLYRATHSLMARHQARVHAGGKMGGHGRRKERHGFRARGGCLNAGGQNKPNYLGASSRLHCCFATHAAWHIARARRALFCIAFREQSA
jgi:hypothetical protein